jgi:hypothetical protein
MVSLERCENCEVKPDPYFYFNGFSIEQFPKTQFVDGL